MNPHIPFQFQHMGSPAPPPPLPPAHSSGTAGAQPLSLSPGSAGNASGAAVGGAMHPGPATSPSQSVPGRRTPLGTVGLGGFYAQGPPSAHAVVHTDENRPGGSSASSDRSVSCGILDQACVHSMNRPFIHFTDRPVIIICTITATIMPPSASTASTSICKASAPASLAAAACCPA